MRLFVTDIETTGLTENDEICEIAGTQYEISDSYQGAIASISTLMPVASNGAQAINRIPPQLTQVHEGFSAKWGNHKSSVDLFQSMAEASDYCVAFNAEFDAPKVDELIDKQKWLCAMRDFDWKYPKPNFRLIDLAVSMGIGISTLHRAADDVRLLVECMNRTAELNKVVEAAIVRSKSPTLEIRALVDYENRDLAKTAGFHWDTTQKLWLKKLKECEHHNFVNSIGFDTEVFSINGNRNFIAFQFDRNHQYNSVD